MGNSRTASSGEMLRLRARLIAERIVDAQYERDRSLEARYGPAGRNKCIDDVSLHLLCLADALDAEAPGIFDRYANWARGVMRVHNVEDSHIRDSFRTMADELERQLPEVGVDAAEFVRRALASFASEVSEPPCEIVAGRPYADLAQRYLEALLERRRVVAIGLIVDAKVPLRDAFLHILTPAQREIGRLWQIGQINVDQEHYCTSATRDFMNLLGYNVLRPPARNRTILGAGVSQELHEVGLRMVCDVFEYEGWRSHYIGANTPLSAIVSAVQRENPDVLALSATAPFFTYRVRSLIEQVRKVNSQVRIMVGGNAFNGIPDLWQRVGADGYAPDAETAVKRANDLLQAR